MRVEIKPAGGDRFTRSLNALNSVEIATATAEAINMGVGRVKNAMRAEMQSVFDRPTNYVLQSVQVVKKATANDLNALVAPTYMGGKGVDPQQILAAQELGGRRRDKRSEKALRRVGILPNGMQTAIPRPEKGGPFPGSDDGRGNLKGSFLVQLIAYFQAFGEQGYRANMTDKRKQLIHERGGAAKRLVGPVRGHRFFVAYGSARGGARLTKRGEADERTAHLAPGIWAARGTGGGDLLPVLMFVSAAEYKPRISLEAVRKRSDVDALVAKWLRGRIYEAAKRAAAR